LFLALFEGGIGEIYRTASNQALSAGTGLRLRLIMRDAAVARLPWEFLYDPLRRDFVALSVQTSIVRQWQEPLPRPFRSKLFPDGRMSSLEMLNGQAQDRFC
jgi:hypothetical protein